MFIPKPTVEPAVPFFYADEILVLQDGKKFVVQGRDHYNTLNRNQYRSCDFGTFDTRADAEKFRQKIIQEARR